MKKALILSICISLVALCSAFFTGDEPTPIPPSRQRTGDATKGFEYLTTGDYIRSGIPYNFFVMGAGKNKNNFLNRQGINTSVSHEYTAVKAPNGVVVVAPNCLQCHAQVFDGKLIMGLGNTGIDFSASQPVNSRNLAMLENLLKTKFPKQYEASASFLTVTQKLSPFLRAEVRGVNLADHLSALLVSHRDPVTFQWSDAELLPRANTPTIPTDTPPWWLLKKKNAMFYNGFGRGDFGRFLMASNLLTVNDTSESSEVDAHMPDVLSYIYSLKAPKFPKPLDEGLAKKGVAIFASACASCHGTYGDKPTYPNLLIPEAIIQTDSLLYSSNYSSPQYVGWFNRSWFTKGDHPAQLVPFRGYIAPPLDGIWITAPYLHNGSVPTLEGLLNSRLRPTYWSRNFEQPAYNYDSPGWVFQTEQKATNTSTYNTTLPGYGNGGHTFGDALSASQRKALIEYLKTL